MSAERVSALHQRIADWLEGEDEHGAVVLSALTYELARLTALHAAANLPPHLQLPAALRGLRDSLKQAEEQVQAHLSGSLSFHA